MNNEKLVAGRYRIIKKIASGGMANVYLGQDQEIGRKVAIKILSPNYASDKSFVARFKREAQILAKLSNPNIVKIYDWGKYNGSYYICMEYIEGSSLKEIIDRKGIISPRAAARYAVQICEALEAAHSNNLIHRDIKPQNILITTDNTVKVTDFGIAKLSVDDATKTLNIIGTAHYISPEQAMGKSIDNRSDIYSLGVVLYEMLTADLPFRGESSIEISLKHINEIPLQPSLMVQGIPRTLEKIVMHCLQKNSSQRYSSIGNLKNDLTSYLQNKKLSIEKSAKMVTGKKSLFMRPILGPLNLISIVAIIMAAVFMVAALVLALSDGGSEPVVEPVQVPDLIGKDYQSVASILADMDMAVIVSEQFDPVLPEGNIIAQSPDPETEMEPPVLIELMISKGPSAITKPVPNLIGLSLEKAEPYLEEAGFVLGQTKEEFSDQVQPGLVMDQNPDFGQQEEQNTPINLTLSKGSQMVTVPNLTGTSYYYALSNLNSLGFEVEAEMVTDYTLPPGTVTGTSPSPRSEAEAGSQIKLLISVNQEMIPVPNLSQQELQIAIDSLQEIALYYEIREVESTYSVQRGLVLSQFPKPGTTVFPNSTVILFVGT